MAPFARFARATGDAIGRADMNRGITKPGLGVAAGNVLLALMYILFISAHLQSFTKTPRLSLLLIVSVETVCLIFVLIRKDPDETWHSWQTWVTTLGGTFAPLLFRPTLAPADLLAGHIIQGAALMLVIAALLSLNRSFGLLPAHRGVKSDGLYRWIRHPLYTAYALAWIGYVVNNFDLYNVVILLAAIGLEILRIVNEETLLLRYQAYAVYAQRTRWRLIPLLW